MMKKLEKWLAKPIGQRLVYFLVLMLYVLLHYKGDNFNQLTADTPIGLPVWLIVLLPLLLLGIQLWVNNVWVWRLMCALLIFFTFWLANVTVSDIARSFEALQPLIWNIGNIGFLAVLILALTFANWVLLHMKPKK